MAAGQGFKTFATGDVLSASDVNGYLMQGVLVFADAAERNAEITSPQEGQFAYLKDTNVTTYYTGSAWANLDTTGMTNPMTTTGDTIYSSSGSTPARLGIGSTGQVLTVAGGVPSWATPSGGTPTFTGVGLYRTANQSFTSPAYTMVQWNAEEFDTDSFHDNSTNNTRITIPTGKGGKYLITAQVTISSASTSGSRFMVLYKNGSFYGSNYYAASASYYAGGGQDFSLNFAVTVTLAAADYIEIGYYQNSGTTITSETSSNHFTATYLGA